MEKPAAKSLPTAAELLRKTLDFIKLHWRILGGVLAVYILVDLFFGSGLSAVSNTISNLNASSGHWSQFGSLFGVGNSNSGSPGSFLSSFLAIIELLVIIYLVRQISLGKSIGVKDTYYKSMQPVIPFLLVSLVLVLEFIPLGVGSAVLLTIFGGSPGILLSILFSIIFLLLAAWSFYMLSGSVFALFLVSQPNATPINALRMSSRLTKGHRTNVISRLLSLVVVLGVLSFIILLALIFALHFLVAPVFYLIGVAILPIAAIYTYFLYQELED